MRTGARLPAVLQALSAELAGLHTDSLALQDELAPFYDAHASRGLQRLDALSQVLEALTAYTGRLAAEASAGAPLDPAGAAASVPLVGLSLRLALCDTQTTGSATAGDVDLF